MTEDYVSFETAKLLKEKGFDWKCSCFYRKKLVDNKIVDDEELVVASYLMLTNNEIADKPYRDIVYCSAPTLQMATKWLREVHNKIIVPSVRLDDRTSGTINCYNVGIWYIPKNNGGAFCYTSPTPYDGYPSFEKACEAGIKYCLEELI